MICILVALRREIEPFLHELHAVERRRHSGFTTYNGRMGKQRVRIIRTGVGRVVDSTLLEGCGLAMSTGFCGALEKRMRLGDIVIATEVAFAAKDLLFKIFNPQLAELPFDKTGVCIVGMAKNNQELISEYLNTKGLNVHPGRTVTCSRIIQDTQEKEKIHRYFNAIAVDMEDYHRLTAVRSVGARMLTVRVVLDEFNEIVPSLRGGLHPRQTFALLQKIPRAQENICTLLMELISKMSKKLI